MSEGAIEASQVLSWAAIIIYGMTPVTALAMRAQMINSAFNRK